MIPPSAFMRHPSNYPISSLQQFLKVHHKCTMGGIRIHEVPPWSRKVDCHICYHTLIANDDDTIS